MTGKTQLTMIKRSGATVFAILLITSVISSGSVGLIGTANAAGSTDLTVSPPSQTLEPSETTTVEIAVASADGGVGSAEFRIELSDPSVASIQDISAGNNPGADETEIDSDGNGVDIKYAFDDTQDQGSVIVATLTLEAESAGTTDIEVTSNTDGTLVVSDEAGETYDFATIESGSLTVDGGSAAFDVSIGSTNSPIEAGDALEVTATIENTGDQAGTKRISLDVPGVGSTERDVQLDAGETSQQTLSIATEQGDEGSYTAEVASETDTETTSVEVVAQSRTGFISGRVSNTNTNPIAGAETEVINTQTGETVATTTTDSEGSYTVEVEANQEYRVEASADGYENGFTTVSVDEGTTSTGDVVLRGDPPTGAIIGAIIDTDANPIAEAEIEVIYTQTGETVATTTSDSDGEYSVEVEDNREYRVEASAEDYENGVTTVDVTEDATVTADVVLTETDGGSGGVQITADTSGTVTLGNEVEVTITLTNTGSTASDSGSLEVTVPDRLSLVDVTGDGVNQPDRFYLDPISPGDSISTTYTFKAPEDTSTGTVSLDMTGSIQIGNESYSASTTSDIEISDEGAGDVEISADTPGTVAPGEEVEITIALTNTGSATAGAGGLEVTVPDRLSLVDVAGDGENQPARFYIDPISPSDSVSTTYTFKAPEDASTGTVNFDVTGTLTFDDGSRSASTTAEIEISEGGLPTEPGEPDFIDVLQVVDAYNTGDTYDGVQVEFIDVLEVIGAYNAG